MANILDKYGIKEVCDVTFYELGDNGRPTNPVLYLDTLKVSTIEQTGETAEAKGGKGNPSLIMWDYNKEITVTLEDALFSAKSMAIMFGNGKAATYSSYIMKTMEFTYDGVAAPTSVEGAKGRITMVNPKIYDAASGAAVSSTALVSGTKYLLTYDVQVKDEAQVIDISANSFPGTYYVVGDTFARSYESGKDEYFQFIIPKAKVTSENTITLEAEGDPSVFNMNLKVLRPASGPMMKLVKYDVTETEDDGVSEMIHNHSLNAVSNG